MNNNDVIAAIGGMDIYLVDQLMKGRFRQGSILLDAGCGGGRNLHWFIQNGYDIYALDADPLAIKYLEEFYSSIPSNRMRTAHVEDTGFETAFFDGIISSAVLHFAKDTSHFFAMLDEMYRVLKVGGTLFIRMASDIGIEENVQPVGDGVYLIPDGSTRFLLTRQLLKEIMSKHVFSFLDDFKTVNVNDIRCMSTLVLSKES